MTYILRYSKIFNGDRMLEFMKEKMSSWEKIRESGKETVIYGMGNGADKVFEVFNKLNKENVKFEKILEIHQTNLHKTLDKRQTT